MNQFSFGLKILIICFEFSIPVTSFEKLLKRVKLLNMKSMPWVFIFLTSCTKTYIVVYFKYFCHYIGRKYENCSLKCTSYYERLLCKFQSCLTASKIKYFPVCFYCSNASPYECRRLNSRLLNVERCFITSQLIGSFRKNTKKFLKYYIINNDKENHSRYIIFSSL